MKEIIAIFAETMMHRKLLLLALLLSLSATMLHAQAEADTVKIETSGNYISIPVTLNGKPKRFILDTGCGAHVVFRHDYRIVRQEEKVKQGGYTITYNKEKVEEAWNQGF